MMVEKLSLLPLLVFWDNNIIRVAVDQ